MVPQMQVGHGTPGPGDLLVPGSQPVALQDDEAATLNLSRLVLNPARQQVQRDLANCQGLHQRLLLAFPSEVILEHARAQHAMLHRVETKRSGYVAVLVQSVTQPDWSRLPDGYLLQPAAVKDISAAYTAIREGQEFYFRLRANPTRREKREHRSDTGGADVRKRGNRVDLRREDDQLAWLNQKASEAGFMLVTQPGDWAHEETRAPAVRVTERGFQRGVRRGSGWLTFGVAVFEGYLRVTDVVRFQSALRHGIGTAKAYGFGLLSLAAPSSVLAAD